MAVIDRINRRGPNGKRVLVGPGELVGPNSNSAKSGFASATRFTGPIDQYEITDGSGSGAGDYTVTVKPYSENGFSKSLGGIEAIAVVKQTDGVATPGAGATLLGLKRVKSSTGTVSLGPFTVETGDKLYVIVDRNGVSTIKYQLEIDKA